MKLHPRSAIALLLCLLLAGCPQQDQLALMTRTLGQTTAKLVELSGNSTLATQLREHTDKAVTAIQAWKPGGSLNDALHWLNFMIDDLNAFPQIEQYRPLIVFALGTIAAIIEALNSRAPGGGGGKPHTAIRLTQPPQTDKELRHQWDGIRAGSPGLEKAPVI